MVNLKPERYDAGEFNQQPLTLCGKTFIADISGALFWPAEQALIVADLDLSARAHIPASDILTALAEAIDRTAAATVICLGRASPSDVASNATSQHIDRDDRETLHMLQEDREWIWLQATSGALDDELGGHHLPDLTVAGLTLRAAPMGAAVTHEIAGHLRPAAKISLNGHTIRRPCFVGNGRRLVLPAFGSSTGGRNVLDQGFVPLFGNGGQSVWMLGQDGLYPVASRLLRED